MTAVEYAEHSGDTDDPALRAILAVLRDRTGTDFSSYRAATVRRRIRNRMMSVGVESYTEYLDLLRAAAAEPLCLLERLTIKVSRFYRNKHAWDRLRHEILPRLAADGAPLRLWSAGCGCGEEPYTLAMLMEDAGIAGTVEASDLDPAALRAALAGRYGPAAVTELPEDLRSRYLEASAGGYVVHESLRQRVRYSLQDLTSLQPPADGTAPYDLVCCRNVLIYFDRRIQDRVMREICGRIRRGGCLFLGEAEWPMPQLAATLLPCDRPARIFRTTEHPPAWTSPCTDTRI